MNSNTFITIYILHVVAWKDWQLIHLRIVHIFCLFFVSSANQTKKKPFQHALSMLILIKPLVQLTANRNKKMKKDLFLKIINKS